VSRLSVGLWLLRAFRYRAAAWTAAGCARLCRQLFWGVSLLAEAATRVLIAETISAGTALLIVKLTPYVVIAGLFRWMAGYTRGLRRQAEQRAAVPHAASTDPAPVLARR